MNAEVLIKKKLIENLGLKNFHNLSRLQFHQKIYKCLSEELDSFIHALEIEIIES